jgi:hypothetical protein
MLYTLSYIYIIELYDKFIPKVQIILLNLK